MVALSTDHKPNSEIERKRIVEAGGVVKREHVYRVFLGDDGPYQGKGGHALSRALGDALYKLEPYVSLMNLVLALA